MAVAEQEDDLLHIESASPSAEEDSSPELHTSPFVTLLQYNTLRETDMTLPADLATDWNVLVSTQLHKPGSFPADLAPYSRAFRTVVRFDRRGEVLPLKALLELEPCFRLCSHHHTPLYVLTKLCTVTSRSQFENFLTRAVKKVQKPLFIAFLRHFVAHLDNFQTPSDDDATTPQFLFAKAVYTDVMTTMQQNETDAPQAIFQKRLARRAQKCLDMICSSAAAATKYQKRSDAE